MTGALIGDSRRTSLYGKQFADVEEARFIAGLVCKYCESLECNSPAVEFLSDSTNRRWGCYHVGEARITLNRYTWGVLAHELAHHAVHSHNGSHRVYPHGAEFKLAHRDILDNMEKLAESDTEILVVKVPPARVRTTWIVRK